MAKPFEHFNQQEESPKQELMEEGEAHETANMMRADMGVFPETSRTITNKEVTPEDYDKALEELEDLKKKAEEEPEIFAKGLYIANKIIEMPLLGLAFIAALRETSLHKEESNLDDEWDMEKYIAKTLAGSLFTDAEGRLRALKTESEMFTKREIKHEQEKND